MENPRRVVVRFMIWPLDITFVITVDTDCWRCGPEKPINPNDPMTWPPNAIAEVTLLWEADDQKSVMYLCERCIIEQPWKPL